MVSIVAFRVGYDKFFGPRARGIKSIVFLKTIAKNIINNIYGDMCEDTKFVNYLLTLRLFDTMKSDQVFLWKRNISPCGASSSLSAF